MISLLTRSEGHERRLVHGRRWSQNFYPLVASEGETARWEVALKGGQCPAHECERADYPDNSSDDDLAPDRFAVCPSQRPVKMLICGGSVLARASGEVSSCLGLSELSHVSPLVRFAPVSILLKHHRGGAVKVHTRSTAALTGPVRPCRRRLLPRAVGSGRAGNPPRPSPPRRSGLPCRPSEACRSCR